MLRKNKKRKRKFKAERCIRCPFVVDRCRQCGYEATSFNSCRSRHCPKCQTNARNHWLAEREIAADPKHLGAEIGFLSVLHTWGQNLLMNPHS